MIINTKKTLVVGEGNIRKIFELTHSTDHKTRKLIIRENERLRLKKKGIFMDDDLIQ